MAECIGSLSMRIIPLSNINFDHLVTELKAGKIMVYPTETVAGIGCVGSNEESVKRLFSIKERSLEKPVSYAFSTRSMVEQYAEIDTKANLLLDELPGPLTIILPLKDNAPVIYGIAPDSIGVRIPDAPWLLQLISKLGEPLITTSTNISGEPSSRNIRDIDRNILDKIDYLISWNGNLNAEPSTVISTIDGYSVLREGAVSAKEIAKILRG